MKSEIDYCRFCYYNISPVVTLDQTYTDKAIGCFQLYINKFPQGSFVSESNEYIGKLRNKLEEKAYNNSKIYYNLEDYKAAVTALKNCLKQYPDSKYREELLFLTLRSSYMLAENSVESKKEELLKELAEAKIITEEKRNILKKIMQKTEALSKLKEDELKEYKASVEHEEEETVDDIVTSRYRM